MIPQERALIPRPNRLPALRPETPRSLVAYRQQGVQSFMTFQLPGWLGEMMSELRRKRTREIAEKVADMLRHELVDFIEQGGRGKWAALAPITRLKKLKEGQPLTPLLGTRYLLKEVEKMPIEIKEDEEGAWLLLADDQWLAQRQTVHHPVPGGPHGGFVDVFKGAKTGKGYKTTIPARPLMIDDPIANEIDRILGEDPDGRHL